MYTPYMNLHASFLVITTDVSPKKTSACAHAQVPLFPHDLAENEWSSVPLMKKHLGEFRE